MEKIIQNLILVNAVTALVIIFAILISFNSINMPKALVKDSTECDLSSIESRLENIACPDVALDCLACQEQLNPERVREVEVIKYVCSTGAIVENLDDCLAEREFELQKATGNTYLEEFYIKPACVVGNQGGEMFWKVGTTPTNIRLLVREPLSQAEDETTYYEIATFENRQESYRYFDFKQNSQSELTLDENKVYIARFEFDLNDLGKEFSDEILIDTRSASEYLSNDCSN